MSPAATTTYEIWAEGFRTNGERGEAQHMGTASGLTFREACAAYAEAHAEFKQYYDAERNTYWACGLFDNEADARKSFG